MKVGILTGGGDCPGLNPVIRGVVQTVANAGGQTIGFLEGWRGPIEGNTIELTPESCEDIIFKGGTILGSSRTNPCKDDSLVAKIMDNFKNFGLDALVAIGGDDTLGVANKLHSEHGLATIGCPKTIDNDLNSTDVTFGFDTSINIVMEAIDRLRTTAESHRRVIVIETMGRQAGWIACYSGIASAADYILIPEQEANLEEMYEILKRRRANGKLYGIVVASEGAHLPTEEGVVTQNAEIDDFGHVSLGGIGEVVAELIEKNTGIETRSVTLGHLQRGGTPSAYDRVLGTRLGVHAGRLAASGAQGRMVALRGTQIVDVPLADAVGELRNLDLGIMAEAAEFFKH